MPAATRTRRRTVCLVSLGCSKALVDSEVMVGHLARAGLTLVGDPADSEVVIVNTCGFIDEARQESLDTIEEYAGAKRRGELKGLVVTGCLVQLHAERLARELPDVDAFLPLSDYSGVPSVVDALLGGHPGEVCAGGTALPGGERKAADTDLGRALLTAPHTAYLRLGEGCNHVCAFCAIPKIRGKLKSKPREVLLEEAAALGQLGVRELTLIAEDSTDYGKDLALGYGLADLLEGLGAIDAVKWIRVMYAHPATIDERLIATMARVPNIAPYLDMPVQHGDEQILRAMRRGTTPERIRKVVGWLRDAIPDLTLRTTILVGFPGETDTAFDNLMALLREVRFDRLGCFTYSPEPGTEGHELPGRVPREIAEERRAAVMELQRELLESSNRARIGTTDLVLVDAVEQASSGSGRLAIGRTVRDAPEVDGRVLVELPAKGRAPKPGDFISVRLTNTRGYDLVGTLA